MENKREFIWVEGGGRERERERGEIGREREREGGGRDRERGER